ncbi:hypothetical protein HPT29_011535 [Microvirga terrae]|uniref:Uncharacterized protein n=1 Tax=Microvirga terrae TaxID=2740529 RepID=A0ABY5RXP1_9HYPH|nr:hypothetical protein [Microvirga terrae]UVF21704.1 hypothetical protein HPT29_011535 [Microvirga terrae]
MGRIMKEDDIFISGLFDLMNLRFGPSQGPKEAFGGIEEMAELQREFQIFQRGRSFRDCVAVLNLGGFWNPRARNRWLQLIGDLGAYESDLPGVNGNDRIMDMMVENLASRRPLPVLFQAHDSRSEDGRRVIVRNAPTGRFYIEQNYIIVSIPMLPKTAPRIARQSTAAARKVATKSSKASSKGAAKTSRTTPRRK